jgi:hypothetical protein
MSWYPLVKTASKFLNDQSMICEFCQKPVRVIDVRTNPHHIYNIGQFMSCPCGQSTVWTNSVRNEQALLSYFSGKTDKYYQGFCNDRFCGKCFQYLRCFKNGVDIAGTRGDRWGCEQCHPTGKAMVVIGNLWPEVGGAGGQSGAEHLTQWYWDHLPHLNSVIEKWQEPPEDQPTNIASNWYQMLKLSQFRGEFWIQGGQAMGADGEINDYNHEGMAIETAQQMIMDNEGDWEEWKQNAAKEKYQEALQQATTPQLQQQVQMKWNDDGGEEFLMEALREQGVENATYMVAEGMGDVRKWAMEHLGWKRLQGVNVETWNILPADLRDIADGVWDAYQDPAETGNFNIYVGSQDKWFYEVPFADIATGRFAGNEERGTETVQKDLGFYQRQMMLPLDGD